MTIDDNPDIEAQSGLIGGEELAEKLYQLPPDRFLELYRLYERLGWQTEVDDEMRILRRRLTRMRPRRTPTFNRILCRPFEFFIGDDPDIAPFHVPRQCCDELGILAVAAIGTEKTETFIAEIRALDLENTDELASVSERLWRTVGTALEAIDEPQRKNQTVQLRSAFDLIVGCLLMGSAMSTFNAEGTREKIKRLDLRGRQQLSRMINNVPPKRLTLLQYPLLMLSRRLENPAEIINILSRSDVAISAAVRSQLTELMQAHLETELKSASDVVVAAMAAASENDLSADLDDLRAGIHLATDSINAGVSVSTARRLLNAISKHVTDHLIEPADTRLREDLDRYLAGADRTSTETASTNPFDGPTNGLADAEACLLTLAELSKHGQALSIRSQLSRIFGDWSHTIHDEASKCAHRIGSAASQAQAQRLLGELYGLVRLLEILDGPDGAEEIRRMGERAVERLKVSA